MMKLFNCKTGLSICVVVTFMSFFACSKKGNTDEEPTDNNAKNRKEIIENIADNIVIPAYAKFKVKLDMMVAKSNEFTTNPNTTTLTEFRSAWAETYTEWQK